MQCGWVWEGGCGRVGSVHWTWRWQAMPVSGVLQERTIEDELLRQARWWAQVLCQGVSQSCPGEDIALRGARGGVTVLYRRMQQGCCGKRKDVPKSPEEDENSGSSSGGGGGRQSLGPSNKHDESPRRWQWWRQRQRQRLKHHELGHALPFLPYCCLAQPVGVRRGPRRCRPLRFVQHRYARRGAGWRPEKQRPQASHGGNFRRGRNDLRRRWSTAVR